MSLKYSELTSKDKKYLPYLQFVVIRVNILTES